MYAIVYLMLINLTICSINQGMCIRILYLLGNTVKNWTTTYMRSCDTNLMGHVGKKRVSNLPTWPVKFISH